MNQRFNNATTPEGRPIAALTADELAAMDQRCALYAETCESRNIPRRADYTLTCAAVSHEINKRAAQSGTIAEAFTEFAELRRQCIADGYVIPPIAGTPPRAAIDAVCDLLREALVVAVPLPDEPADVTTAITDDYRAQIDAAIKALNAPTEANQRPQF